MNKGCFLLGGGILLAILLAVVVLNNFTYRVDSGKVGLLVNYSEREPDGSPKITEIPQLSFVWYNSWASQAMFEYSISLQTLTMVANPQEGQQAGNDAVSFPTQHGIPLSLDVSVQWRVTDPKHLYLLMPNVPLDGDFNHDVSSRLIRQSVRHALTSAGSAYAWDDVSSHLDDIEQTMLRELTPVMRQYGVTIEQIALSQPHYDADQLAQIHAVSAAQQKAQQAQFLKQQAQYEADATTIQAQAQANQIKIINQQLSNAPDYLRYLQVQKWDGKLPGYLSTDGKESAVFAPMK